MSKNHYAPKSWASPNRYLRIDYSVFQKSLEERLELKKLKKSASKSFSLTQKMEF